MDQEGKCVLKAGTSLDNCYTLFLSHICHNIKDNTIELWHERLGHLKFTSLNKIASASIVRGLPSLNKKSLGVCEPCQYGKQLKTTHKVIQGINTTRLLELLHMHLMGPIQVESITCMRYVFVCVDDFFQFTWVDF